MTKVMVWFFVSNTLKLMSILILVVSVCLAVTHTILPYIDIQHVMWVSVSLLGHEQDH
jgi:hypothetical protein